MNRGLALGVLLLLFPAWVGFVPINPESKHNQIARHTEILESIMHKLDRSFVDEFDVNGSTKKALDAMLADLDPYTNFYSGSQIERYKLESQTPYGDIGAEFFKRDKGFCVRKVIKGFPADLVGIKAGDFITKVNGESVADLDLAGVRTLLGGSTDQSTTIDLLVGSSGTKKSVEVDLKKRDKKDVSFSGWVAPGVAYVKLDQFMGKSSAEILGALAELEKEEELKGLVFDLRANPGGLLSEAIMVSSLFIPRGSLVVETRGKDPAQTNTYKSPAAPKYPDLPLVCLVNEKSASASEIVSGVMQDYDRGVVLGQTSLGKGLVQVTKPIAFNTNLKLTVAKYYIPSGRCIQALDYSAKGRGQKATKVPDSLRSKFKTANGRVVMDGAGIEPDLLVETKDRPVFLSHLFKKHVLFDFATKYAEENPKPNTPAFSSNEKLWGSFKSYYAKEYPDGISFKSETQEVLADLKKQLKKDKYLDIAKERVEALEKNLEKKKDSGLDENKDAILYWLEREIASRYYYEEGRRKTALLKDKEVKKALELLSDPKAYSQLLKP